MPDCPTCGIIICGEGGDIDLFSLQSEIFPFVLLCPSGYNCDGLTSFTMVCCGQTLTVTFEEGATEQDRILGISNVLRACVTASASCSEGGIVSPSGPGGLPPGGLAPGTNLPIGNNPSGGRFQLFRNAPQSATATCPDGSVFTLTVQAGLFAAGSQSSANQAALAAVQAVVEAQKICIGQIGKAILCKDVATSFAIGATGLGSLSFYPQKDVWQLVSGSIPTGMSFTQPMAVTWYAKAGTSRIDVLGTPTAIGTSNFVVRVTGPTGRSQQKSFTIDTVEVSPSSLSIEQGVAFSQQLSLAGFSGSASDITWDVTAGALPDGITLSESGLVSGTATGDPASTFTIAASVTLSDGRSGTCSIEYEIAACTTTGPAIPASFLAVISPDNLITVTTTAGTGPQSDTVIQAPIGLYEITLIGGIQEDVAFPFHQYVVAPALLQYALDFTQVPGEACEEFSDPVGCPAVVLAYEAANAGQVVGTLNMTGDPGGYDLTLEVDDAPTLGGLKSGSTSYSARRVQGYSLPLTAAMLNYSAKLAQMAPEDSVGAPGSPQWDGQIGRGGGESLDVSFDQNSCIWNRGFFIPTYVGNVQVIFQLTGSSSTASNIWDLHIIGLWSDGVDSFAETLWYGTKSYGSTPEGDYVKNDAVPAWRADAPNCVTIANVF